MYPGILYGWVFAKYAAAFFKNSICSRSSLFSFRSRIKSSTSELLSSFRLLSSTHLLSFHAGIPNIKETDATLLPGALDSQTALSWNSCVYLVCFFLVIFFSSYFFTRSVECPEPTVYCLGGTSAPSFMG